GKELPTLKDVDFLNKSEKVYVGEEDKRDFMEKLKRDVEGNTEPCMRKYGTLWEHMEPYRNTIEGHGTPQENTEPYRDTQIPIESTQNPA
ncbi:hypothetical protein ASZ78_006908, partial [Callipepla squamata]